MRKPFLVALTGLALVGCGPNEGTPPATPDAGGGNGGPCQIKSADEARPAYPFNFQQFKTDIWPGLQASCGLSGCHLGPNGQAGFSVWPSSEALCPDTQSFNSVYDKIDLTTNPSNSILLKNMDGTDAHFPLFVDDPLTATVRAFIQAGFDELGGGENDLTGFFDQAIYEQQIQPQIDALGCTNAGCHNKTDVAGNLGLNPNPAAGSAEMEENFARMTTYVDPRNDDSAEETLLYVRFSDRHRGIAFGLDSLNVLKSWIQDAIDKAGGPGNPVSCTPNAKFNVGVFQNEIRPLLEGRVDYNDIDSGRTSTGCARSECHGRNRGAGTFYLDPAGSPEDLLDSFRCFIDTQNPSASQVLLCPLNLSGCNKRPHPGSDIFFGVDDLNYQKLLSYIYATENGNTPLDFAFFVRKINPIFNDQDAVQDGLLGLTCASTGCHFSRAGVADNGSNFPILPEATDPTDLFTNYISAANFTFFPDATQSSLFLYPTNEVANVNNPLATGLQHPGGECFAVDDQEAIDVLKFSGGIRPNAQAFLQDFLIAGLFAGTDVTDDALFNEDTVTPKIFDRSGQGQQFNQGQWDGFFSLDENIDFLQAFAVDDATDQIAYAVAYVINTTTDELETVVTVDSENDVQLFVGDASALGRDGQGVSLTVVLPSFANTKEVTRIMLKAIQQVDDATFAFTMQFTDEDNNLLTDATKELVFTLSSVAGGI